MEIEVEVDVDVLADATPFGDLGARTCAAQRELRLLADAIRHSAFDDARLGAWVQDYAMLQQELETVSHEVVRLIQQGVESNLLVACLERQVKIAPNLEAKRWYEANLAAALRGVKL